MLLKLNTNIAINDLRIKIDQVKAAATKKTLQRLVIEIKASAHKIDLANSLLLNVKKMVDGTLVYPKKSEVKRKYEDENEQEEDVDEEEIMDALENPEEKKVQEDKQTAKSKKSQIVLRQEFLNPTFSDISVEVSKTGEKNTSLKLTEDEIVALVDKEFIKSGIKSNLSQEYIIEDNRLKNEEDDMQENDEDVTDFNDGFKSGRGQIILTDEFKSRLLKKKHQIESIGKNTFKKITNEKLKFKPSHESKLVTAVLQENKSKVHHQTDAIFFEKGLFPETENFDKTDKQTRTKLTHQNILLKKL